MTLFIRYVVPLVGLLALTVAASSCGSGGGAPPSIDGASRSDAGAGDVGEAATEAGESDGSGADTAQTPTDANANADVAVVNADADADADAGANADADDAVDLAAASDGDAAVDLAPTDAPLDIAPDLAADLVPDLVDDAGTTNATEVCRAAIRAQCERAAVCFGDPLEECLNFQDLCPDYYFNPDSDRTVAGVRACTIVLASRSCFDVVTNTYPSCFVDGKRPDGAGCASASQCQSGDCSDIGACGFCRPGGVPVGGSCATVACGRGAYCHPVTRVCMDASGLAHAGQGQRCDFGATAVVGCEGDLVCHPDTLGSRVGTCTAPRAAGQPCGVINSTLFVCAAGTFCPQTTGATCAVSGACGAGPPCDGASYCAGGDGGMACAPRAAEGQVCGDPGSGLPLCVSRSICRSGRCVRLGALRDPCDAAHPCSRFLTCLSGRCESANSLGCPANLPGDGGTG